MEKQGRINLRGRMLEMAPGEQLEVRDFSYTTVRSYCSDLSWAYGRKFRSHRNREAHSVTVTRES